MPVRPRGTFAYDGDGEAGQTGSTWWRPPGSEVSFGLTDTIPGDTSTTASVAVGGFVTAVISPGNDTDWFSLNVIAGETYLVSLRGNGADPIDDPHLILHDNLGAVLIDDDDGGADVNSFLTFTASSDTLEGGAGIDKFLFRDPLGPTNVHHIVDFLSGTDKFHIDDDIFAAVDRDPVTLQLPGSAFVVGSAAADALDRIIYDPTTGNLYYDSDGTGAQAQILFAVVDNAPATLAASDFFVV